MTALVLMMALWLQEPACRSCDVVSHAASALAEGNAARFLQFVDKRTPGYAELEQNVTALLAANDVSASLDVLEETGDEAHEDVLVDWYLQARSKDGTDHLTQRRMRVTLGTALVKGKWKIVKIDPRGILDATGGE